MVDGSRKGARVKIILSSFYYLSCPKILIYCFLCVLLQTLPLISQSRRLVREGPVTELMDFSLKDTERKIYLHLFNDYLLLSLQKEWVNRHVFWYRIIHYHLLHPVFLITAVFYHHLNLITVFPSALSCLLCSHAASRGGRFTVIDHAPVSDLRVENCRVKLHSLQKNLFRLHLTQKALLLRTDTQ